MKRAKFFLIIFSLLSLALSGPVFAQTAKEIVQKAIDLDDGDTEVSLVKLATCRYTKKGKKTVCAESPRVKLMEGVRKDYGPTGKDKKSIQIVKDPPGERGIGFLQYDYELQGRETDQWMYYSALNKVKRIVSGNENEPKTGSFFGSEINHEDMEEKHIDDYVYKIVAEETYRKRPCWVVESIPTPKRARKSNYSKTLDWIDKERFLFLKSILFSRSGKKIKRISMRDYERVDGVWIGRKMLVNNLRDKRMTKLTIEAVSLNIPVADDFLTLRTLTDGSFREGLLQGFRRNLK